MIDILIHIVLTWVINIFIFVVVAVIWTSIISLVFRIRNEYLPTGWVGKLFSWIMSIIKPAFRWIFEKLFLLFKMIIKLVFHMAERLLSGLAEIFKRLSESF